MGFWEAGLLFGKKDTINEIFSGGKRETHGLCVAIPDGAGEAIESWYVTCSELEDAKMWVDHALNKFESRAVHSLEEFQYEYVEHNVGL
jgi:hypothetical protein